MIDLFAGAGLFSFAFRQVGFALERAYEVERDAAATYRANLGERIEVRDLAHTKPEGRCDVLIAGPPCQGFSRLGRCDDTRNGLSLLIPKWVRATKPSVVVIENVPQFVHTAVWRRLARSLARAGYIVSVWTLDAADVGVAQHRLRSFTFASLNGEITMTHRRRPTPTVADAWHGLPRRPDGLNHHYSPVPSALALERMKHIPAGGDRRDIVRRAPHLAPPSWSTLRGNDVTDVWGRLRWHEPSNTLKTTLLNASKGRYIHPSQNRVLSLREAARLHSIPDSWCFEGRPYPVARQIGNSVPPALGRTVARAVLTAL